jgi:LacI family transcriptional regulator
MTLRNHQNITLAQIAKLAGVSLTTASRVINDLPGVKPVTRERVLEIIHEYGYEPNPAARSLATRRSHKEA